VQEQMTAPYPIRPDSAKRMRPAPSAVGGTSPEGHRAGLAKIFQAGAQPISWISLACELQQDWARNENGRRRRRHLAHHSPPQDGSCLTTADERLVSVHPPPRLRDAR